MDVFYESVEYQNPILCMNIWRLINDGLEYPVEWTWHHHKEVEILTVEQGSLDVYTPDNVYRLNAGDSCIIGSMQLHFGRKIRTERLSYIILHIDLNAYFNSAILMYYRQFAEVDQPLNRLNYIFEENEAAKQEVARIVMELHNEMLQHRDGFEIATSMLVTQLLLTLQRNDHRKLLTCDQLDDLPHFKKVITHINEHIVEKIELKEVCKLANMSYSYFSKYFKKKMGVSFIDYVNQKKIQYVQRILLTQDIKITELAEKVSIENIAHFYELFKRYTGCTPKEYVSLLQSAQNSDYS